MKWAALFLAACGQAGGSNPVSDPSYVDQCMRREIFFQCLAHLPKGPDSVKYNDWDDVVSECGQQAYYQAIRHGSLIKPECKP